jgi:hypothetical protein
METKRLVMVISMFSPHFCCQMPAPTLRANDLNEQHEKTSWHRERPQTG